MIIGTDYLLEKPFGPSVPKQIFDTRVLPLAVNGVGRIEVLLARSSTRSGIRPPVIVAGVAGLASLVAFVLLGYRSMMISRKA